MKKKTHNSKYNCYAAVNLACERSFSYACESILSHFSMPHSFWCTIFTEAYLNHWCDKSHIQPEYLQRFLIRCATRKQTRKKNKVKQSVSLRFCDTPTKKWEIMFPVQFHLEIQLKMKSGRDEKKNLTSGCTFFSFVHYELVMLKLVENYFPFLDCKTEHFQQLSN